MPRPLIDDDLYEEGIDIIIDDDDDETIIDDDDDELLTDKDFELLYALEQQGAFI